MDVIKDPRLVLTAVLLVCLTACAKSSEDASTGSTSKEPAATTAATIHWSYEGAEGPANWGSLSPDFRLCSAGTRQSPIDLAAASRTDLPDPVFRYQPGRVNILNNGHTLQVEYDPGSELEVDGKRYTLAQFHFHAPSEHSVKGILTAAELHLVHRSGDGALAVVGVLIKEGGGSASLQPVLDNPPPDAGPVQKRDSTIDAANLLPAAHTTYRYDGSLTTPPCAEGVKWLVMTQPATVSTAQLSVLTRILHGNHRPVQPVNGRPVVEDTSAQ